MRKILCLIAAAALWGGTAHGAVMDDLNDAAGAIASDYNLVGAWFGDNLAESVAQFSGGGIDMPANVCRILGFEVGASYGGDLWDLDRGTFRGLPTNALVTTAAGPIDLPASIIFPQYIIHAKLGLPGGFDAGAKYGGSSFELDKNDASFDGTNTTYGVELRKHLIGRSELSGLLLPDLSINVSLDGSSGELEDTERYDLATEEVYHGNPYTQTITSSSTWKSTWNSGHAALKLVVSKTLPFVTPFLGISAGKNFGETKTTITSNGTVSLTPALGPTQSKAIAVNSETKTTADNVVIRYFGGVELRILLVSLGVSASYSADQQSAYASLRYQFR